MYFTTKAGGACFTDKLQGVPLKRTFFRGGGGEEGERRMEGGRLGGRPRGGGWAEGVLGGRTAGLRR